MLHHQGGGPLYGARPPEVGPFSPPQSASVPMPLSIHPPPSLPQPQPETMIYDELAAAGAVNFPDDDALGDISGGTRSGAGGRGAGGSGNRWPREETLALIRIRSEMDATFRGATLKGPLWEEVSRKLAELGYQRSAKKCKEKFENVDKYYKRTKEGRAGRQDGKSYRFFSQLEALHAAAPSPAPEANTAVTFPAFTGAVPASQPMAMPPPPGTFQPTPISAAVPMAPEEPAPPSVSLPGFSFSSLSDSDWDDEPDDDEVMRETGVNQEVLGKRKLGGGDKKVMALFEGMMKQVMEQQEAMQRRFLETLERREAERTAREEAWRRQEVARLNREQEQLAQERAAAASRDAAVIAFLNRVGGQFVQLPPISVAATPAQMPAHIPPPQQKEKANREATMPRRAPPPAAASLELVPVQEPHADTVLGGGGGESGGPSPSRWPKAEVHALIQLRVDLETRYHDAGQKGSLWEEISAGMRLMGYNRNAKRCKEKWENINKYYKKVKESNKKRPDDSKTCPYFHQLDAIYHRKLFGSGAVTAVSEATASEHHTPSQHEIEGKSSNDNAKKSNGGAESMQVVPSNGETAPAAAVFGDSAVQKPEDIARTLNEQPRQRELTTEETDSDDMGGDHTDDGEDSDDDGKMQYRVQFQTPNAGNSSNAPAPATAAAVPTSTPTSTFLGMVQ